jgi:hypothetical protein
MNVCVNCFQDSELKKFVESSSVSGKCDFCSDDLDIEILSLEELLDFFAEFLNIFQEKEESTSLIEIIDRDWKLFSSENISSLILAEIMRLLKSSFTSPNVCVGYIDEINSCVNYWDELKEDLKWRRRFLTDIDKIIELGWDGFFNQQSLANPNDVLFRARIHTNKDTSFSLEDMGCPNKMIVSGGRANPQGIPYLYLSKSAETTFYETRTTYLDEVSVGEFKIKEDNKVILVDFTECANAFLNLGDILNYTKSLLLKKYISSDLSKPLKRTDSELEYIPTQFICEFIRYITNADGIIFNSSLHLGGVNIVLFDEYKVECTGIKKHKISNVSISGELYVLN